MATSAIMQPLYFFYDCEATANIDLLEDRIVEVAAILYTKNLEVLLSPKQIADLQYPDKHYTSLCSCDREIDPEVVGIIHLTSAELQGQPPLAYVLDQLFEWITKKVKKATKLAMTAFTPVLVAHAGHKFDFPLLIAELERINQYSLTRKFEDLGLYFADSYTACKALKDEQSYYLHGAQSLGVQGLYTTFFPYEHFTAHRALSDAKALCRIFTESMLQYTVSSSLQSTMYDLTYIKDILELVKVGFHNLNKIQTMVKSGSTARFLHRERFRMTRIDFLTYLRRNFGIVRPQARMKAAFHLE